MSAQTQQSGGGPLVRSLPPAAARVAAFLSLFTLNIETGMMNTSSEMQNTKMEVNRILFSVHISHFPLEMIHKKLLSEGGAAQCVLV